MNINITEILFAILPNISLKELWLLIIQGTLIFTLALFLSFFILHITKKLRKYFTTKAYPYSRAMLKAIRTPMILLVWLLSISWFIGITKFFNDTQIITMIQRAMIIILLATMLLRTIRNIYINLKAINFENTPFSSSEADTISKVLQFSILASFGLIFLQSLGISISGLLAFGGIGGLAMGLAAKDALSNIFGGMMLHIDRPFQVGERITIPGKSVEGTVTHIGWRQTCVQDYALQPIYIPNAMFGNAPVVTPSRMPNRRIKHLVGIRYQDFQHLTSILEEINHYLRHYSAIDQMQPIRVHFINYGAYSLDLQIYCFTKVTSMDSFLSTQEEILMNIGNIIQRHGADFAFPTQTLDVKWPESPVTS